MPYSTAALRLTSRWCWPLGGLLVVNLLLWLGTDARAALGYPYGFDFGEGILWNQARLLAAGQTIYGPIDQPPWLVANYPPLYMTLVALLSKLAPTVSPLLLGRVLSLGGSLGIMALLALMIRRTASAPRWLWVVPLLWLVTAPAWRWSLVMRVDTLGIALVLLGLAWGTCTAERRWIPASVAFIAAVLTKHSLIAGFLAWCLSGWLMGGRARWHRIFALSSLMLVLVALNMLTAGGFLRHTVGYTANEFHGARLRAGLGEYLALAWPLWALVLLYGSGGGWQKVWSDPTQRPWLLYLPLATFTLITFGATGSDSNYYLEPLAALLGTLIVLATANPQPIQKSAAWPLCAPGLTGALLACLVLTARWGQAEQFPLAPNLRASRAGGDQLVALLHDAPDPVLSEDFSFTLAAGKTPDFQPYIFRLLAVKGKWEESAFVERLRTGTYSRLVLPVDLFTPGNAEEAGQDQLGAGFDRLTPAMEEAIRAAYQLAPGQAIFSNGSWYVYEPRP